MGRKFVLVGMLFGDEGKGTFVDYLAYKYDVRQIIRYNGGSQASHTVTTPEGIVHKFSQLGSGMFKEEANAYLSSNMVVNPCDLIEEVRQFSLKTNLSPKTVLSRIFIDEKCYIVTPYHKFMNHLRELGKGNERRGSVGSGVSEVRTLLREKNLLGKGLGVQMKDLYDRKFLYQRLEELYYCVFKFYKDNKDMILRNMPDNIWANLQNEIEFLTDYKSINYILCNYLGLVLENNFRLFSEIQSVLQEDKNIIFEASQGLLLDENYGLKPNTTILDTTIKNALSIIDIVEEKNGCDLKSKESQEGNFIQGKTTKIGITKAFSSRHGLGVFPTEDAELNACISDLNQEESFWNGKIRFGWFDAVLVRYAQAINQVDELYLSSVDRLSSFKTLKICDKYLYTGVVDDDFKTIFEYEQINNDIIIVNIKESHKNISKYLIQCKPIYTELDGWNEDISMVREKEQLPNNCLRYICQIENLTTVKVSTISVGPTRTGKVLM
ncbi:MAG: adenylosuccinate synthetase [Lachnospiraceae bacterium]|jgi:adenylosuccinate synthase|nr:adenylosuccinate synthetase [Lachnospiraceae bacterium]